MAKNWTEEDEEFIRDNFLEQTYSDLADHFGVSTKAMESKIRRMGLKKQDILAEAAAAVDDDEEEAVVEEPSPEPIDSIPLHRRTEEPEETEEERRERIERAVAAAEEEKERREAERDDKAISGALKKLETGMKKMMAGDFKKASADFEAILSDPPGNPGLVARARQFLDACNEQLAKSVFQPKTADDFYLHGVTLMNAGDLSAALDSFEKARQKAPKDDKILYCQAAALAQTGDVDSALEALKAAIDSNDANRIYAKNDSDFIPLRVHKEFQELVAPPEEAEESA